MHTPSRFSVVVPFIFLCAHPARAEWGDEFAINGLNNAVLTSAGVCE